MADQDNHEAPAVKREPPRGVFPARLDDRGRMKLPVVLQQFLGTFTEKNLFVTSLDQRIAQIYPIETWRLNEKLFEDFRGNPAALRNIKFNANAFGGDADVDNQGRVTFPQRLRKQLGLDEQPLHIYAVGNRLEILTESLYQAQLVVAAEQAQESLEVLEMAGLK